MFKFNKPKKEKQIEQDELFYHFISLFPTQEQVYKTVRRAQADKEAKEQLNEEEERQKFPKKEPNAPFLVVFFTFLTIAAILLFLALIFQIQ